MRSRLENELAGQAVTARLVDGAGALDVDVTVTPVLDANDVALDAYDATSDDPSSYPVQLEWILDAGELTEALLLSEIIEAPGRETSLEDLVTLTEVKDYLNIQPGDGVHDIKLARAIQTARPLVEAITGPIIPTMIIEWHDGGTSAIQVRRRPSTAPGTFPVLTLLTCAEFSGSTRHDLALVADPSAGSTYSVMLDTLGTITRRTGGGAIGAFAGGERSVLVEYIAGQSAVPANVVDGTLELIRVNYNTTQATGTRRMTVADDQDGTPHLGWFMPRRVRELLAPNRRHPSVA